MWLAIGGVDGAHVLSVAHWLNNRGAMWLTSFDNLFAVKRDNLGLWNHAMPL
jgi:hypothetical protein